MRRTVDKSYKLALIGLMAAVSLCMSISGCKPPEVVDEDKAFEESFTKGEPDLKIEFPEKEYINAKELRAQKKSQQASKLLLSKLEDARMAGRGTTRLGLYLVRLNNVLYDSAQDRDAIKYGEIAVAIFRDQPLEKRPMAAQFVNVHSYLGFSYERLGKWAEAERNYLKAIQVASGAPKAEVSQNWIKLLYDHLAIAYKAQNKPEFEKKVREQMKTLPK
jgi:tetratricopeptide (TPR) repeat protein